LKKVKEEKNYVIYENEKGIVKLTHFALAFGEPQKTLNLLFDTPEGYYEAMRHLTPDEAIQFAYDLINMAVKVKEKLLKWEANRTPAY